jgi:hypothetical protein
MPRLAPALNFVLAGTGASAPVVPESSRLRGSSTKNPKFVYELNLIFAAGPKGHPFLAVARHG